MRLEIVHEEVMSIVNEEVKCVNHLPVIANQWHLDCLLHYFDDSLFRLCLLLQKLDLHLLL